MKRTHAIMLSVSLLTFVLVVGNTILSSNSIAGNPNRSVVILVCVIGEIGGPIEVTASSSSSNAPNIAIGTDCAQALADLRNEKIKITDVQIKPRDGLNPTFNIYTLQR